MRTTPVAGRDRKIIPVLPGFLLLSICSFAQDLPTGKPESVGLSSERLERIGTAVPHEIDGKRIAGTVTLVIRHGHVAWFKSRNCIRRAS